MSIGNQIGEKVFVKVRQQFGSAETTQLVLEYELSELLRSSTAFFSALLVGIGTLAFVIGGL